MSAQGQRILTDLDRHKHIFDFTRDRLAEDVAEGTALAIFIQMELQKDGDGTAWSPLSFAYSQMKAEEYPGRKMAELELHMMTLDQLTGFLEIFPEGMAQTYGLDEQAQEEACWFQEGFEEVRPARGFYWLNQRAIESTDAILTQRFNSQV